jgi:hypothetical protein
VEIFYKEYHKQCQAQASSDVLKDLAQRKACFDAKIDAVQEYWEDEEEWELPVSSRDFKSSVDDLGWKLQEALNTYCPGPAHEQCAADIDMGCFPDCPCNQRDDDRMGKFLSEKDIKELHERRNKWGLVTRRRHYIGCTD